MRRAAREVSREHGADGLLAHVRSEHRPKIDGLEGQHLPARGKLHLDSATVACRPARAHHQFGRLIKRDAADSARRQREPAQPPDAQRRASSPRPGSRRRSPRSGQRRHHAFQLPLGGGPHDVAHRLDFPPLSASRRLCWTAAASARVPVRDPAALVLQSWRACTVVERKHLAEVEQPIRIEHRLDPAAAARCPPPVNCTPIRSRFSMPDAVLAGAGIRRPPRTASRISAPAFSALSASPGVCWRRT